jgi:hypothetical protein
MTLRRILSGPLPVLAAMILVPSARATPKHAQRSFGKQRAERPFAEHWQNPILAMVSACFLLAAGSVPARAAEGRELPPELAGFAGRAEAENPAPASMCFARTENGESGWATVEWGKAMLAELERSLSGPADGFPAAVGDILAFRDWCLGAPGGVNLALAISAEETAVELLFRELAGKRSDAEKIRDAFRRCPLDAMTADCWLETLSREGIAVDDGTATDKGAAGYRRLEAVFTFVVKNCAGAFAGSYFPKTDWPREGCLDEFNPYALVWRSMILERKKVALETCLAIQEAGIDIPEEREGFRRAAERFADGILGDRARVTSWMTAYDAWDRWSEALEKAGGVSQP